MVDGSRSALHSKVMAVTQSRTVWGFEFGRHRVSVTRVREARTIGCLPDPIPKPPLLKRTWPVTIGTFVSVSAFGLAVIGARASERDELRYAVSVPVPTSQAKRASSLPHYSSRKDNRELIRTKATSIDTLSGIPFDAEDEAHVARAMKTGEFQEWLGPNGQRHFLNAGSLQVEADRRCRDLVLLVRRADSSNHTRSARRCMITSADDHTPIDQEKLAFNGQAGIDRQEITPQDTSDALYDGSMDQTTGRLQGE